MPTIFQTRDRQGRPHPRWRFKYVDYQGVRRTATGKTTRRKTEELALHVQAKHHAIRNGWVPVPRPCDIQRPIETAMEEYLAWGRAQGGHHGKPWSGKHHATRARHLRFWVGELRLGFVFDLYGVLPKVEAALRKKQNQGLCGKTVQNYAESIGAFCDWLVDRDYLKEDPLRKIGAFDTTPVRIRRAFTVGELQALLRCCKPAHRLSYLVAVTTGLRRSELRALRRRHLDAVNKALLLDGAWTKNRRSSVQPLPEEVFDLLKKSARVCGPDDPILRVHRNSARMIADDMKKAGIPKVTEDGVLDFHSLRVTYTSLIIEVGASVKEAQALARHSSPELTMNVYARTRKDRLADVVNKLGEVVGHAKACPTSVQRNPSDQDPTLTTPDQTAGSESAVPGKGAGSNPATVPAEMGTKLCLLEANPGHQHHFAPGMAVESRTLSGFVDANTGQSNCPTVVQRPDPVIGFCGTKPRPMVPGGADFSGSSVSSGFEGVA